MARITGFGGVFFHSPDPKALAAWYRDTLGFALEDWGGALLKNDGDGAPHSVWAPFDKATGYFKPSTREFMINFAVDDLNGFLVRLEEKNIKIIKREEMAGVGSFAWIVDPDGTKIEFWQPAKA